MRHPIYLFPWSGALTDLHDELEAFQRGQLFGDNSSVNFTTSYLSKFYPNDPAGPINISSPYTPVPGQSYGQAVRTQLFNAGEAGVNPTLVIKDWQNNYVQGLIYGFMSGF